MVVWNSNSYPHPTNTDRVPRRVKFAFRSPLRMALLDQFHFGVGYCTFRDCDGLPLCFIGSHELRVHIRSTWKRFPCEKAVLSRCHAAHGKATFGVADG